MFTGIITDIGELIACERKGHESHLRIRTAYDMGSVALGASIACNGICLTVTDKGEDWFAVTASAETTRITTLGAWAVGTQLNLERALKVGDELGGHLVSGHVDGTTTLTHHETIGDSHRLTLSLSDDVRYYVSRKGSITLDGISLTVNEVSDATFSVMIIPHSWTHTTLSQRKVGDTLNLEIDPLARVAARLMEARA